MAKTTKLQNYSIEVGPHDEKFRNTWREIWRLSKLPQTPETVQKLQKAFRAKRKAEAAVDRARWDFEKKYGYGGEHV